MKRLILALCFITFIATCTFAAPKIGIMTGTVSQGEEEYRAAEEMIQKYGKDRVLHVTYPDKFMDEQETTISQVLSMASDPEVKAIVIVQAIPGTAAATLLTKSRKSATTFYLSAEPWKRSPT